MSMQNIWDANIQNHGKKNKRAGKDWAAGFRNRNQELSLRKPENTSAARSFAFNKTAVAGLGNPVLKN